MRQKKKEQSTAELLAQLQEEQAKLARLQVEQAVKETSTADFFMYTAQSTQTDLSCTFLELKNRVNANGAGGGISSSSGGMNNAVVSKTATFAASRRKTTVEDMSPVAGGAATFEKTVSQRPDRFRRSNTTAIAGRKSDLASAEQLPIVHAKTNLTREHWPAAASSGARENAPENGTPGSAGLDMHVLFEVG